MRLTCVLLLTLRLTGYQTGSATHTLISETPFYLDGPQQARPADGTLAAGTHVTLLQDAGSYAQVSLPDGRQAYVSTASLKPLR